MSRNHLIKRSVAVVAAIGAAGFPAVAQASLPIVQPNPDEQAAIAASGANAGPIVQPNPDEQVASISKSTPPTIIRVSSASGGFDWGDAGIGAGGTAVLLGAGLFGAGMARRRRTHQAVAS
jgi:hypothetical protein